MHVIDFLKDKECLVLRQIFNLKEQKEKIFWSINWKKVPTQQDLQFDVNRYLYQNWTE